MCRQIRSACQRVRANKSATGEFFYGITELFEYFWRLF
jgi:hypothetical protein